MKTNFVIHRDRTVTVTGSFGNGGRLHRRTIRLRDVDFREGYVLSAHEQRRLIDACHRIGHNPHPNFPSGRPDGVAGLPRGGG